jgi:hypothetical protein
VAVKVRNAARQTNDDKKRALVLDVAGKADRDSASSQVADALVVGVVAAAVETVANNITTIHRIWRHNAVVNAERPVC